MLFEQIFPVWDKLTAQEKETLRNTAFKRTAAKGRLMHNGASDCVGLILVCSGQLRAFISSDEGREITLYRLFAHDMCLFSASCMMRSIQFDVALEAEKDAELWIIPADVYKTVMEGSAAVANYTNELMASRFSEVMWLIEQIMWKSFDKRLAAFLLEESAVDGSEALKITHDRIAAHMGTAREVVTRQRGADRPEKIEYACKIEYRRSLFRRTAAHLCQHGSDAVLCLHAHGAFYGFAVFYDHKRRNAHDAELCRKLPLLIHVHLSHLDPCGFFADFVNDGREHAARAAPVCPEVQQHRLGALHNLFGKVIFRNC